MFLENLNYWTHNFLHLYILFLYQFSLIRMSSVWILVLIIFAVQSETTIAS